MDDSRLCLCNYNEVTVILDTVTDPTYCCRQLQPNDYTGLELYINMTSWDAEVWAGNKVSLGIWREILGNGGKFVIVSLGKWRETFMILGNGGKM
jgi:hypothetical protein